jgi:hypothetical protein
VNHRGQSWQPRRLDANSGIALLAAYHPRNDEAVSMKVQKRFRSTICVSHSLLPKTARLTFCDRCWDDDVRIGSQPHIRRDWTYWATVHCSSHRTFLSARYGNLDKRNELVSWQDVWASDAGWRAALNLQRRSEYSGSGWYKPFNTDHWDETMRDLILDVAPTKFR